MLRLHIQTGKIKQFSIQTNDNEVIQLTKRIAILLSVSIISPCCTFMVEFQYWLDLMIWLDLIIMLGFDNCDIKDI